MQIYDGQGISVVDGGLEDLVRVSNTKYDFEAGTNKNFHWEFYGASQNLLQVKGSGYKIQFSSGLGAVNFAHCYIETNLPKLIRSAEIVQTESASDQIEAAQSGATPSEIEGLNPSGNQVSNAGVPNTVSPGISVFRNRI
jgi:hypothetical protein